MYDSGYDTYMLHTRAAVVDVDCAEHMKLAFVTSYRQGSRRLGALQI